SDQPAKRADFRAAGLRPLLPTGGAGGDARLRPLTGKRRELSGRKAVPQAVRPARRHAALAVAVLTVILLSTVSDTIYDKQQQLQGLNGQIVATRTQIRQLLDQERALQAQIAALGAQLAAVQAQINQETAKLVLLGQQVEQAKAELATKQAELAKHIADFGQRMRIMYKAGQVS